MIDALIEGFGFGWHPDRWTWIHGFHFVWLFTHGSKTGLWLGIMLPLGTEVTQGLQYVRDPQSFFDPSDLLAAWICVFIVITLRKCSFLLTIKR